MASSNGYLNRILRNLPESALQLLEPHLVQVRWGPRELILEAGSQITHVYFPQTAVVSLVSPFLDGRIPELASIGREGISGSISAIGSRAAFSRWTAQVPGTALQCPASVFEDAFEQNQALRQAAICYMEALHCQTMQSVACNAMHPVEARCCRWILMMRDRTDTDEIPLTQEFLSEILSVHRSSVSLTVGALQQAGYLQAKRGSIRILDRAGLENVSCECYQIVRDRFEALLPGTFEQH
jgi:CRP-like cAMP-binding protein